MSFYPFPHFSPHFCTAFFVYQVFSSGLPVIEFEDGTFSYFFSKPSAILTGLSGKELYIQLKKCIHEPDLLKTYMNNASILYENF